MNRLFCWATGLLFLLAGVAQNSHAATLTKSAIQGLDAVVEGKAATIVFRGNGVPILTTATPELTAGSGWVQAGNYGVAPSATVALGTTFSADGKALINGTTVPVSAAAVSTAGQVAAGLAGLAGGPWGLVASLAIPAVADWINANNAKDIRINAAKTGLEINSGGSSTVSTGMTYSYGYRYGYNLAFQRDPTAACMAGLAYDTRGSGKTYGVNRIDGANCFFSITDTNGSVSTGSIVMDTQNDASCPAGWFIMADGSCAVSAANWLPASMNDIAPYMAKTQPAPAVAKAILDNGGQIEASTPVVTGPATQQGAKSTTQNADGSTTVNNTTNNYTYADNRVTNTSSVTTSTTTKPDGTTSTTTSTTENPVDEGSPTDTALAGQPKLYERKYPDGLTGIWDAKKATLTATPMFRLAATLMPSTTAGQCPKLTVPLDLASWASYGDADVSVSCDVWSWAGVIIVVSALLLARSLVFGG